MSRSDFKYYEDRDALYRNSKGKVKPAPELPQGVRLADTHCHLGMLDDPALAIARAAHFGFGLLECITDPAELSEEELSAQATYDSVANWLAEARLILDSWDESATPLPQVRMASGVHPHNAKYWAQAQGELAELLARPETSCLGEIGLDYHYDFSPREEQREVFARQLVIAQDLGLPVSLHIREAHGEAADILREVGVPGAGAILHCFNLGVEDVKPFLELGCYIALGGPLTFKRSYDTRAALSIVPLDRLLIETDAPYMTPEPLRGVACFPDHATYTLRTLLDCAGYSGRERALELVTPRPMDVPQGEEPQPLIDVDASVLNTGLDELAFAQCIYQNSVDLLNSQWDERAYE